MTGGGFWLKMRALSSIATMHFQTFRSHLVRFISLVGRGARAPTNVLQRLIDEVESTEGYPRNEVRAKAKAWLISHVSFLGTEDILLARMHFGYLLPTGWGDPEKSTPA